MVFRQPEPLHNKSNGTTMLTKFRRRLVALNVAFVGIILILVCFFSCSYSEKAIFASHKESFESSCTLFENSLTLQNDLNYRNVYEFEQEHSLYLYVTDNGIEMVFPYTNETEYRNELLTLAKNEIELFKSDYDKKTGTARWEKLRKEFNFTLPHEKDEYFAKYVALPNSYGAWLEILMLQSMEPYKSELFTTRCFYFLLTALGFVLITGLNYVLAKKAIQPAIKAQQAQSEFIAAAGHELKSPLAVILSGADMLSSDQSHYAEYQANIISEAKRMTRLVDDLLLLARLDLSHTDIEPEKTDTEGLLLSTYEKFLPIAGNTSHTLTLNLPGSELPDTYIDEQRIVQVLSILLTNAFSYTDKGTSVEITAYQQHRSVAVSVIDHGGGIAEKKKVFDKFYRTDKGRSQKEHFGLGLSIAAELMRMHGSEISLTDTPGKGATFTIFLPIEKGKV